MGEKLFSLALAMVTFSGLAFFLITQMNYDPAQVLPLAGGLFALWFIIWLAWAFRWIVVFAPVVISYAAFAFYDMDASIVQTGAIASGVLFVLTGIQHGIGNRKRRKAEKEEDAEFKRLKRRREGRR